jgi:hypothetical protein
MPKSSNNYGEVFFMICPYCKETIEDGATTCRYCGAAPHLDPADRSTSAGITTDEISALVGPNSHYYLQNFSKFSQTGIEKFCPTWNWSAFCFSFIWMLYRKMYVPAVITFVIFCLPGINIILHVVVGVVGNYLYYRHVQAKIVEIRQNQTPQRFYPTLHAVGGIHLWVIWVAIIFSIILVLLIALLFASIIAIIGKYGGMQI